jgi:hypothetical protein
MTAINRRLLGLGAMALLASALPRQTAAEQLPIHDDLLREVTREAMFEFNIANLIRDKLLENGFLDVKIVCNETNSTPERVERSEFWADVWVWGRPAGQNYFVYLPIRVGSHEMIEDAVTVYKTGDGPTQRIFYVDTSSTSRDTVEDTIRMKRGNAFEL